MKKGLITGMLLILAVAVLAACGSNKYEPVAINEDTDKCAICNMQVKDDAFATQLTTKEGKTYKFDDIGCMNEWKSKNGTDEIGAQYVRDYNNKEWIKYEDAYYAYDSSFRSPMAYGIYSFKDEASAKAFIDAEKTGTLLKAADLANHSWSQNMEQMGGGHGHDHGQDGDAGEEHGMEEGHGSDHGGDHQNDKDAHS
ncbi:nitrous oxide reductase accessory protein NosL [Paenibacillus sp. GCM10027626]|uniref:nitrous oxide reductase accessory protein NosL n=1 Tax=Paenibacillus sp. GCM10027626 TaxID=3273411 RepID=UPI0036351B72